MAEIDLQTFGAYRDALSFVIFVLASVHTKQTCLTKR
jgi:hypothetical protein